MLSTVLTGIQPFAARAGRRQPRFSPAATRLRCESGAACSSSRRFAPHLLRVSAEKQCNRPRSNTLIVGGPQPDTEEEGSALDFPEEYVRAVPSRRPDIFPDLKEPKQPMPKPMPGDPEVPDEEEEEEERKKNPGEPGTNPDEDEDEENPKPKKKDDEEEE